MSVGKLWVYGEKLNSWSVEVPDIVHDKIIDEVDFSDGELILKPIFFVVTFFFVLDDWFICL